MPDIDYNELFGTAEANESENTPEVADPAQVAAGAEDDEGVNEPELADPADDGEDDVPAQGDDGDDETDRDVAPSGEKKRAQSMRERAGFAAARREAEERARAEIAAEKARAKAEMESFVRSLGVRDADGKLIETPEAYAAYNERRRADELRTALKRSGIDPDTLEAFVSEHPAMKEAKKLAAEAEAEKQKAREAEWKAALDEEMRQVEKIDPTVKTVADLREKPYFDFVYGRVKKGYSLVDAVTLATEQDRLRQIAEGSAKSAAAKATSKSHMVPTSSRGQGAVSVPAETLEVYRQLYPGITDAEIQKKYQKVTKIK